MTNTRSNIHQNKHERCPRNQKKKNTQHMEREYPMQNNKRMFELQPQK